MISERRSALRESANWEKRRGPSADDSTPTSSLKDRLAALTKSADGWQNRVRKDDDLTKLNPSARRKLLLKPPSGKENTPVTSRQEVPPPTKVGLLLNLDKGLESFFPHNTPDAPSISLDLDFDSIRRTEILKTPRRPRPHKMGRERPTDVRLTTISVSSVHIEEDARDFLDSVPLEDDGGGPVARSAKAGLEAVEDYSAAKGALRQADTTSPYPSKMLIRVKGEKKVDVRIVAPVASAIHQSAVFILVTPDRLLTYEGENSNILERTKAAQICISVTTKGDLHCSAKNIEKCQGNCSSFFRLLDGGIPGEEPSLPLEPFECMAARINLVIRVTNDYKVQSVTKGERVRFSLLQPKDTLIFDFGSEIYVWSGRLARKTTGRYAVEYAQQLRSKPIPHSEGVLGEDFSLKRADWILYRRVMQGVQDVLFSSKFCDWQTSETKGLGSPMTPKGYFVQSPFTRNIGEDAVILADSLKSFDHPEPCTTLEDHNFTRSMKDVITESISFWQLQNEQLSKVADKRVFLNDQCYVVRWQYRIQLSGVRRLRTGEESEKETGRERVAFFYWLGSRTTAKQQGLCALKLSHMDREKRPHVRIAQGYETPLFLQLFGGKFIVRSVSPESLPIFLVRGATAVEGHAVQLDSRQPLRTHAVYIRMEAATLNLIAGTDCSDISVQNGIALCDQLREEESFNISPSDIVTSSVQGDDPSLSWITSTGRSRCPRLYRIYETEADELVSPQFKPTLAFPFPQEKLTDTILVDAGEKLWIWSETPPPTFALRVAERFWEGRRGEATVILKASEPDSFVALFASWEQWPQPEEEKSPPRKLQELMVERTQTYPLSALRSRTQLPEGIDTKNLEQYLNDVEFTSVFKMERSQFDALPMWKQIRLRKEAGLF